MNTYALFILIFKDQVKIINFIIPLKNIVDFTQNIAKRGKRIRMYSKLKFMKVSKGSEHISKFCSFPPPHPQKVPCSWLSYKLV